MHERDEAVVSAVERLLVHEPDAHSLEPREDRAYVRHLETQVMDPRAALLDRLCDRAALRRGFEKLDFRIPEKEKSNLHLLFGYLFDTCRRNL